MKSVLKILFCKIFLLINLFFFSISFADNHNIYEIIDQLQKDIKTLEKAVYQKSDVTSSSVLTSIKSDGLNEDIMTKHLLKLNEIVSKPSLSCVSSLEFSS